jgi:imidazoleglycerol phosphate dehydratase HisB
MIIIVKILKLALEIPVSKSSIQRILKTKKYHPYKISLHQELSQVDKENRINFYRHMLQRLEQQSNFRFIILFSDE